MTRQAAIKPHPMCKVCNVISAGDDKLKHRINVSGKWVPGGEYLKDIQADYVGQFSVDGLENHATKHQAPNKAKLEKQLKTFATNEAFKQIETVDEKKQIAAYTGQADARKDILDRAMKALDAGDVKLTMSSIVALLGQEQKAEENAKDRGLKMMEMFNYFASGAGGPVKPVVDEAEFSVS